MWIGAFVTAVLFDVGKLLIGLYLGKSNLAQSFEAAGSLVVLLAWVYYAAQIFLMGAEFTRVFAQERTSGTRHVASSTPNAGVSAEAPETPGLVETPASRMRMKRERDPALDSPALHAAEAGTRAALVRLITQVMALAVIKVAGMLVSRRRRARLNQLVRGQPKARSPRIPAGGGRSAPR